VHKINGLLQQHENWLNSLEIKGTPESMLRQWDTILGQMERNLTMREMIANTLNMNRGMHEGRPGRGE